MRGISSIYTVVGLVLIVAISHCFSAQASQPQGPVKESQKNEQSKEERGKLTSQLFQAMQSSNLEKAKELIAQGAYINVRTNSGDTLLVHAIKMGELPLVEALISGGADINARDRRRGTALHAAALGGYKEVVELLIASGANVTAHDRQGNTPLDLAIRGGHIEIVKLYLQDKTSISTAFSSAIQSGNNEVVKQIIGFGVDVNVKDKYGLTPLHYAVINQYEGAIRLLLEKETIVVDAQDNFGRTALHYAAGADFDTTYRYEEWPAGIVQLLLDGGADINAKDSAGRTPLFYVFLEPDNNGIKFLVERGADLNSVDNRGYTPLSYLNNQIFYSGLISSPPAWKQYQLALKESAAILQVLLEDDYCVFVAPDGEDTNSGALHSPFKTIAAALDTVKPGDSVIVRGGLYRYSRSIHISKSGDLGRPIRIVGYPGESATLDFSETRGPAFLVQGSYWHFNNLSITGVDLGVMLHGENSHHNILEQLRVYKNRSGVRLLMTMEGAAYNMIINCDVYDNCDLDFHGGSGDGIQVVLNVGPGNILIGNRAWNNSDDGYDCSLAGNAVRFERCYAWGNGQNIWDFPFFAGDANGFKLGGGAGRHILINCIAWGHPKNGFGLNDNQEGVILRNCTAWNNGSNYFFEWTGWQEKGRKESVFINNISYDSKGRVRINKEARVQNNSWDSVMGIQLTDDDFLSLDDSMMSAPRNPDGSIPHNDFLKLAPGSAAIDKGVDVGIPFVGAKPDLGAFEYDPNETSEGYVKMLHQAVRDHDLKQIEQLLAQGEGINDKDWLGYTPLHWAIYFGYPDLTELLISKGADPDIQSDTGRYALEIARAMAYPELEALLRKLGAKAGNVSTNEDSQETKAAEE